MKEKHELSYCWPKPIIIIKRIRHVSPHQLDPKLVITAREPGTTRFSRTFSKWWIVRVKTRTKAFFFEEILINFPLENLPKLNKERMQNFCPEAKLKELSLCKCKQLFHEQVARTKDSCKDDYKFSTAKDPLFNSTRICKVEDYRRPTQMLLCTYRYNLSMLEHLDYSLRGKE